MKDVLSDIFDTIRLRATFYFRTDFSPPWAITVPAYQQAARFHLVVQGRCHVALATGLEFNLGPGDLIVISRGQGHVIADRPGRRPAPLEAALEQSGFSGSGAFALGHGNPDAATQMVCGHFNFTKGADHTLLQALPDAIVLTPALRARHALLDDVLRLVVRRALAEGPGASASISRLSEAFFIETVRASVGQAPEIARVLDALVDPQVGRALELIHGEPAKPWTVEELARAAGMSRSRFAERFSRLVGLAPMAYVSEWRLQRALADLTESNASIKQVARSAGYRSPAAFTRAFSQRFGIAPTGMRTDRQAA